MSGQFYPFIQVSTQELRDAININICKVHNWTSRLNHPHPILKAPTQGANDSQSHHRSPMNACRTMNKQLGFRVVQRMKCELNPTSQDARRLGFEIVIYWVPQHLDPVRFRQSRIIELDLHIDDVGYTPAHQIRHLLVYPDSAPNRYSVGDPCNIHWSVPSVLCSERSLRTELSGVFPKSRFLTRLGVPLQRFIFALHVCTKMIGNRFWSHIREPERARHSRAPSSFSHLHSQNIKLKYPFPTRSSKIYIVQFQRLATNCPFLSS